jgi:hypothetical protein
MDKKAQLTLFIIIGIILVFSVAIVIYLQQQIETAGFEETALSALEEEARPIKLFVDKCLSDVATQGLYFMGTQGGYIAPPLESLSTETSTIPYYYQTGSNEMPSLTTLEDQIADYVEGALPICVNDFEAFPQEITTEEIRVTTRINEQNVLVKAFYPITVKLQTGKEERIENFVVQIPIRLGHIYDVAQSIVEESVKTEGQLNLNTLVGFDVKVDVLPYDASATIFAITDSRSKVENIQYQLFFANNFGSNTGPELDFIPDFALDTNKQFEYTVTAHDQDGDQVTFTDDSQLFDINTQTGVISFTPRVIGAVDAMITASDGKGKTDSTTIRFDIR